MNYWKRLLLLFFALVVFDGALRKWVLPAYSNPLYFLKDFVLIGALVLYVSKYQLRIPRVLRRTWFPMLLAAYGFWVLLEMGNPHAPNFAVSLFGARSHLLYACMLIFVPSLLPLLFSSRSIRKLLYGYVFLVATPVMLLGIYQFFQPPGHWVNTYVAVERASGGIATAGLAGRPRITGTFSYISGMTVFLIFNISLGFGILIAGLKRSRHLMWLGGLVLTLSWIVVPMTGSRGAVLLPLVPLPIVFYVAVRRHGMSGRLAGGLVLVGVVLFGLLQTDLSSGWQAVTQRMEQADDAQGRIVGMVIGPIEKAGIAGLIGYGTGTAHQAAPRLVPGTSTHSWMPSGVYFEGERERVALELGFIGLILYALLKLRIALFAYEVFKQARNELEILVGAAALSFSIIQLAGSTIYNVTAGGLYWGLAAVTLAVWCAQRSPVPVSDQLSHQADAVPA